jgi:uncharacterized protein YjbJ (UPF0337 family)
MKSGICRMVMEWVSIQSGLGCSYNFEKEKIHMNWDQAEGKWKQVKGLLKEKWGKLTNDDLDLIAGKRDKLVGKLQERYGIAKEEAEKQSDEWIRLVVVEDNVARKRSVG